MEDKPSYYAIIPAEVRYDKCLKDKSKLLFGEISTLSNKEGICWASNSYFADLYGVSVKTISNLLKELENQEYIKRELVYKENSKEIDRRYIQILPKVWKKSSGGYGKNFLGGMEKKFLDNNTSINNTSINNKLYVEIINYLNDKADKKFKPVKANLDMIHARIKEGFTIDDFKKVIDTKCSQWLNDKQMNKFLRPDTLFRPNHFQAYLNETDNTKKPETKYTMGFEDQYDF